MIKKIKASGYRLLDDFEADLKNINVIIGSNATGKSTLIDLLQLICQLSQNPIFPILKERGGIYSILHPSKKFFEWCITFTKPENNPIWSNLSIDPEWELDYQAKISIGDRFQPYPQFESLKNSKTIGGHKNPFKYFESIEGRNVVFDFQVNKFVDLKTPMADITQTSTFQDENITAEQLKNLTEQGPSLLLEQLRFHDKFRDISLIRLFFSLWAFYPGFDVSRYSIIRNQPNDIEPSTILSQRGENLASVLHEILTRHAFRDERDNLLNFLHVAYPFFENISPETVPGMKGKVVLKWHESDLPKPIEVWELSDGILRFLCLGAVLCNPQPPPLVCIDEPELGFHPRLIPIIGDMIKSAAEKTQLIITTHSPDLLNSFYLDDIAVMTRENGKAIWHRPSFRNELKTLLVGVEGENLGELHRSGQLEVS